VADKYELVGTENPDTDWTTEVILEKNDDGTTKKSVGAGRPSELNENDRSLLEGMGFAVRKVSKEDEAAMELQNAGVPGATDVVGASPFTGGSFDDTHVDDGVPESVKDDTTASDTERSRASSASSTDQSNDSPKGK